MITNFRGLQERLQRLDGFEDLRSYENLALDFLRALADSAPTKIVAPNCPNYIFYQYGPEQGHRITRPLNTDLFVKGPSVFQTQLKKFHAILDVIARWKSDSEQKLAARDLPPQVLDSVLYTIQQSLGSIADSLSETNQARKRAGQLFEGLIKLTICSTGLPCEGRVVKLPLPGHADRTMSYELDMVISRENVIVASETRLLLPNEIVGSVKTTSKDRIDKIFLDKFMMSRLLERNVRVVAVFLHDVQRARHKDSRFGINSTFKSNHFLGYSIALQPLDGVYYVDPRPAMATDPELAKQIGSFSSFLVRDLWRL